MNHVILGIDIGGTNTKLGLTDINGHLMASSTTPTQVTGTAATYLTHICREIDYLLSQVEDSLLRGIGVGAPGAQPLTGKIADAANMPWAKEMDIKHSLESFYQVPVCVDNDANAAAMGELKFGGAKGLEHFIVVTLGTGLGSGIVINGEILYGHGGLAGEIGHTIVERNGRRCACGKRGCLETYASGTGLKRNVMELIADDAQLESSLHKFSYHDLNARQIASEARRGDQLAKEAYKKMGYMLGSALADAVAYTHPEAIFLGGGMTAAEDLLLPPVIEAFDQELLGLYREQVKIECSALPPNYAAVLGAASLVLHNLEHHVALDIECSPDTDIASI